MNISLKGTHCAPRAARTPTHTTTHVAMQSGIINQNARRTKRFCIWFSFAVSNFFRLALHSRCSGKWQVATAHQKDEAKNRVDIHLSASHLHFFSSFSYFMDVLDWTIVHTAVHRIGVAATARCCLSVSLCSFSFSSRFLHSPRTQRASMLLITR